MTAAVPFRMPPTTASLWQRVEFDFPTDDGEGRERRFFEIRLPVIIDFDEISARMEEVVSNTEMSELLQQHIPEIRLTDSSLEDMLVYPMILKATADAFVLFYQAEAERTVGNSASLSAGATASDSDLSSSAPIVQPSESPLSPE